ncbi:nucleoside phosphatase GDA1/CD39 [Rhizopus microsporus var. microsporus]|uniref:guanosine-diphosphatase n=2 Tax=Rhizopus microsporus TaxID=58291 RepID=A0A2G4SSN3_RHIZD|nr:nucleoside phosphatase GDA1/CD39 [Rhizopus microsporus ATCC 52813]ORE06967.1 nucleoside phosphatase GDA1/CD39 [Rhizopus microsporus var. microsporus]PHZ11773.1 nucleoside phosphatase GDA1/CD39 [Rhizopus microsporus ATCC 52813]
MIATSIKTKKSLFWKCGLVALFIILFLWLLYNPSSSSSSVLSTEKNESITEQPIEQTTQCLATKDGQASTKYAIMIDAGSSGSRVHVYKFNICNEPVLENEEFHMLKPGLSSFQDDPEAAAASLNELLDIAVKSVPQEDQSCTPIAVKATAGLRLLGAEKSEAILQAVRRRLETYPFPIAGENGVEIMDGKDEGVYAWITVNFLLDKLKKDGQSAAIFDLGGASTQIVFEPTFVPSATMAEGEHKYSLDYQNDTFTLYQHSYLGYGLNEARKRIKAEMIDMWQDEAKRTGRVYHPCLPDGHEEKFDYENSTVTLIGTGAGHAACRSVVERVFNKDKLCETNPCAFDGVYQPPLTETFKDRDLYVFSYFYDLTQPLGMPSEFSVRELGELTTRVCNGERKPFRHMPDAIKQLSDDANYCLNLSYIYNLLKFGYNIPSDRLVRTAKKIRGAETGWCLGASIAMLDQVNLCKA